MYINMQVYVYVLLIAFARKQLCCHFILSARLSVIDMNNKCLSMNKC